MSDYTLRAARIEDKRELKHVWRLVFGDTREFINGFFSRFFAPENCVVAEAGGSPVSAMYALRGLELAVPGREPSPVAYLYALGTLPAFRSRGFGRLVTAELSRRMYANGAALCCTMPATEELYRWYERCLGARAAFCERRARISAGPGDVPVRPISALEYLPARETLLSPLPHIRFPLRLLAWQENLSKASGGGLFAVGGGVAAVEKNGAALTIKELLSPPGGNPISAARALLRRLNAESAELRVPEGSFGSECFRLADSAALLPSAEAGVSVPVGAYWGLVFD